MYNAWIQVSFNNLRYLCHVLSLSTSISQGPMFVWMVISENPRHSHALERSLHLTTKVCRGRPSMHYLPHARQRTPRFHNSDMFNQIKINVNNVFLYEKRLYMHYGKMVGWNMRKIIELKIKYIGYLEDCSENCVFAIIQGEINFSLCVTICIRTRRLCFNQFFLKLESCFS